MAARGDKLIQSRLQKLENVKQAGVNPYPATSSRKHTINDARQKSVGEEVSIAGRLMSLRGHGGSAFGDVRDASGQIQVWLKKDTLGEENYALTKNFDPGDFIEVEGKLLTTQAGELTVEVASVRLLTKSVRPLPSEYYGLKDVEERFRKRYADLILNPRVKEVAQTRSKIVAALRDFLINKKGYFEVETPYLQPLYGGTRARPFKTHHNALDMDLYLRISTELYLKRLIVGGFEKVFELGRTFRNEGMDRHHNPEFTMLETMEAYADYKDNMNLVEEMFEYVVLQVFGTTKVTYQGQELDFKRPWKRVRLTDLFKEKTGVDFHAIETLEDATKLAKSLGVEIHDYMTDAEILLEVFEKKATVELTQPTFVYDYPVDFYPLAKRSQENPKLVESFDIYVAGLEMGTNYSELNDPEELRNRWLEEKKKSQAGNEEAQQTDEDFLEALEYGMPPTSGIGPGIDRWVMVLTDSPTIRDVILFPTLRPVSSSVILGSGGRTTPESSDEQKTDPGLSRPVADSARMTDDEEDPSTIA